MKKLVPLACAAIVGALMMATPALAGVSGATGGDTTTVDDRTNVYTNRTVSTSKTYLAPVIRDQGNRIVSNTSSSQSLGTYTNGVNGRSYGYAPVGTVVGSSTSGAGSNSWTTFLRTSYEQIGDNLVNQYYTKVGTTLDRTRFDSRDIESSSDLIVIGDSDNLASQYTAQGERTVTWNWTDFYWNDLHRTDVRQRVFNKYDDYSKHTVHYYVTYQDVVTFVSPIVLNMDGTGKLMASRGNHKAHGEFYTDRLAIFDFYGSGEPKLMEWVGPKDGLLCVPKADGRVDGTCLFGIANGYENGYEELAATRDANNDGVISGKELDGLYVWQDANGNAIAGSAELKTVQELGITSISTKHQNFKSSFTMNGATHNSWDWWPSVKGLQKMAPRQG